MLSVSGLSASYGAIRAVTDISFEVGETSMVAILGANGAGKSTTARVISGLVHATAGSIAFGGTDITRWPAWRIARAGIAHVPEGRSVFASLTVEENLVLAARSMPGGGSPKEALDRAFGSFPRLAGHRHQLAGTLSGGEQRMLSLAKALAVPQRLLVVDEVSLGLAPSVVDEVFGILRAIRRGGTSLLIVEQHLDRVLSMADRAVMLVRGRVVVEGEVGDVRPAIARLLPTHPSTAGGLDGRKPAAQQFGGDPRRPDAE